MTIDDAHSVLILLRWMGWKLEPYDVAVSDAWAADALAALADHAGRTALVDPVPTGDVYTTFEGFCERLHGTAEAEQVCELMDALLDGDVIDEFPGLYAAFDRWKATRATT